MTPETFYKTSQHQHFKTIQNQFSANLKVAQTHKVVTAY